MRIVVPVVLLGICVAVAAGAATKSRSSQPAPRPAAIQPIMSNDGLEGLREVFLDPHLAGEAKWSAAVGMDYNALKEFATSHLKELGELKLSPDRSMTMPRLLVQVMGHTVPNYSETNPPAAMHMTVALMQPVFLTRPGPEGRPIQTSGMTYHATVFSTCKASDAKARVREKIGYLLDEFIKDYQRANPKG